jgi:hypothetical protein
MAVWVFNGADWQPPSGVFSTKTQAEEYISVYRLSGLLTAYPVDIGVYEWAASSGFVAQEDTEKTPELIANFSHASLEHYHYEDGVCVAMGATEEQRNDTSKAPYPYSKSTAWLFTGSSNPIPSGVFSSKERAASWITDNRLTGQLTEYPLNISIYDWAIEKGALISGSIEKRGPNYIQGNTYAGQPRYECLDGVLADDVNPG